MPTKRGTTAIDMRIYKAVVNAVMSHRLPPGTHLGEADFCELYNVSRTIVAQGAAAWPELQARVKRVNDLASQLSELARPPWFSPLPRTSP